MTKCSTIDFFSFLCTTMTKALPSNHRAAHGVSDPGWNKLHCVDGSNTVCLWFGHYGCYARNRYRVSSPRRQLIHDALGKDHCGHEFHLQCLLQTWM
ncbi:hypothetical protein TNCV_1921491 [Trichonephila clavipes]|nr:hypothetical protein TNCV_1921491 [Trichonephila clavipes]